VACFLRHGVLQKSRSVIECIVYEMTCCVLSRTLTPTVTYLFDLLRGFEQWPKSGKSD